MTLRKHACRTLPLALCAAALLAAGCASAAGAGGGAPADDGAPAAASALPAARARAMIVPRVDHHQHIVGPTAVLRPPAPLPAAVLPPEVDRVLQARSRAAETGDPGNLYTEDAQFPDRFREGQPWIRGAVGGFPRGSRLVRSAFAVDDSVAPVSGVVLAGDSPRARMNSVLGLKKNRTGAWRSPRSWRRRSMMAANCQDA